MVRLGGADDRGGDAGGAEDPGEGDGGGPGAEAVRDRDHALADGVVLAGADAEAVLGAVGAGADGGPSGDLVPARKPRSMGLQGVTAMPSARHKASISRSSSR